MRYIVFPSIKYKSELRPSFSSIKNDDVAILAGPTESGLYLIDGDDFAIQLLKILIEPYYVLMEDFEPPIVH